MSNKINVNGRTSQEYRKELRYMELVGKAKMYIIYELFANDNANQIHVPPFDLERYTLSNFKGMTGLYHVLPHLDNPAHHECFVCNNDAIMLQFQVLLAEGTFDHTRYAVIVLRTIDQPVKDGEVIAFNERGIQSHYVDGYRTADMPLLARLMRAQRRKD